jgi:hypothetical protein
MRTRRQAEAGEQGEVVAHFLPVEAGPPVDGGAAGPVVDAEEEGVHGWVVG